jgi:hypothetical protein
MQLELAKSSVVPDHWAMTVRSLPGQRLSGLVWVSHQMMIEEAEALRSALEEFSGSPFSAAWPSL